MKKFLFCSLFLLNFSSFAAQKETITEKPNSAIAEKLDAAIAERLVNAIYKIEGGDRTKYPYGIKSIDTKGDKEAARRICLNTINRNYSRWIKAGKPGSYLDFLGNRFCPAVDDPEGNRNWRKNIKKISGLDF